MATDCGDPKTFTLSVEEIDEMLYDVTERDAEDELGRPAEACTHPSSHEEAKHWTDDAAGCDEGVAHRANTALVMPYRK